jgi:hypothetical protein
LVRFTHLEKEYGRRSGIDEGRVGAVFGRPANPELQGPDRFRPSRAGQRAIARALVEHLTA